ncbi:uncharacterized protein [Miscanthus floridulus]|uniref:uncharacterized protein isoform X2 n=1 Tax=Miscanthus floridulus TaxID=154761 RepID=UPI0034586B0E
MCAACTMATWWRACASPVPERSPPRGEDSCSRQNNGSPALSRVSSLAFPQLFPNSARRTATRLAEANRLFALSRQSFPPLKPLNCLQIFSRLKFWCPAPAMGSRRYGLDTRRCGIHSAPSKSMYLDAQPVVSCQATVRDHDVGSCAVKHHFPSPIVSWIEDLSSFGNASFSSDSEYVDEQARASVGQSSTSSNLHDMQISVRLTDEFMELAKENTSKNLETCGILGASFRDGTYFVTMLIIPKQEGTAHSCQAVSEEEIHAVLSEQSLYPAGWIHEKMFINLALTLAFNKVGRNIFSSSRK